MNLKKLKDTAIEACVEAGKYLNKNKQLTKKILSQNGRDIKLVLDQETEKLIRRYLEKTNIEIMGEEFGGEILKDKYWVIDPIDGTSNYFRGLDSCCISIALVCNNNFMIGVIFNFNNNQMYHAVKGEGAYLNNEKIKVSKIDKRKNASITTGFPASETISSSIEFLDGLSEWKKVRMFGSAALSCAYVASGKCDYYAEKGVYLWDFAAGICLVSEAGGKVEYSLIDNERYEVIISNGLL